MPLVGCRREGRIPLVVVVSAAALVAGCSSARQLAGQQPNTATSMPEVVPGADTSLSALRARPLHLPTVSAEETCPVTTTITEPSSDVAPTLGDGPARPVIGHDATISMSPPINFNSTAWGGQKVLWVLHADSALPVLVRGHQLDGDGEVRFNNGDVPASELVLDPSTRRDLLTGGWYDFPGFTRVRQPGCYGYQIDAPDSSTILVFKVVTG